MFIEAYLMDQRDLDWSRLLADWARVLPSEFTVWIMNRYGDLFLVFDDGTIHMLDVSGSLAKVAENRDDFCRKIDEGDNANIWLMIPLVDQLVETGVCLSPGQCYSFLIPPILGGEYSVGTPRFIPISEHYGVYASYHEQLKDLLDGTIVRVQGHQQALGEMINRHPQVQAHDDSPARG